MPLPKRRRQVHVRRILPVRFFEPISSHSAMTASERSFALQARIERMESKRTCD